LVPKSLDMPYLYIFSALRVMLGAGRLKGHELAPRR
jgi:hypothetical protein